MKIMSSFISWFSKTNCITWNTFLLMFFTLWSFLFIKSRFGQLKLPIKTWVKLYHAIIKQILLYGSEIWGPVINFKNWDKTSIEKLQLEIIKNILGVHRSTSNDACRAELGLYPLKIEIQKRCVQFWHHLHQSDPDSIQYKALLANETSAESHPLNTLAHQLVPQNPAPHRLQLHPQNHNQRNWHKSKKTLMMNL